MKVLNYLFVLFSVLNVFSQEGKYIGMYGERFKINETVMLFGDNVRLREEPNMNAKVLKTLKIGEEVTVLSSGIEDEKPIPDNEIVWEWYKVKYKNIEGYVYESLLSLDYKVYDKDLYLVSIRKDKNKNDKVVVRLFNKETNKYEENSSFLGSATTFKIRVFGNKGLKNIKSIFLVDAIAEACGVDGGGVYWFNDGSLKKGIAFSSFADGGSWFEEKIVFPNDKEGVEDKIVFIREVGETIDYKKDYIKKTVESCAFDWEGEEIKFEIEDKKDH
ncbi:SH3 domain-containing protein [uncultured Tenacibaculum sp.]|uniref:SH3 domain-containing protein n=1 Tax=uncultured Tenacibaculum sp. TaxID=174713 RepID=UPI00261B1538|nr:SH3 domain-containing protein [uncultured Tenacibaculum sp.]